MKLMLILLAATFFTQTLQAATSWFDKQINDPSKSKPIAKAAGPSEELSIASIIADSGSTRLYDKILAAGVPEAALVRTFQFLDINGAKDFPVQVGAKTVTERITNQNYAVIIDYSVPSSERRFYFIDLNTGNVDKYYVAHGRNTGEAVAQKFSNQEDSKETSLGLYLTGDTYIGHHGNSLHLYGLEPSNSHAFEREIVMHGATYVSTDFLQKYGRMGRSWGCPAVSMDISKKIIPLLKNGAVVYAYHKDLMPMTSTSPAVQEVSPDKQEAPTNGDNVVPEEVDP